MAKPIGTCYCCRNKKPGVSWHGHFICEACKACIKCIERQAEPGAQRA